MKTKDIEAIAAALLEQGRTWRWLARVTDAKPSLVYAYSCGARNPNPEWVRKARAVLEIEETR